MKEETKKALKEVGLESLENVTKEAVEGTEQPILVSKDEEESA